MFLHLGETHVTDTGAMKAAKDCLHLTALNLTGAHVTSAGGAMIMKLRPRLEVIM